MKTCKRCGKSQRDCTCYTDVNLEHTLEQFKEEKKRGHVKDNVTEEQVKKRLKEKPPQTENDLIAFCNFIGLDQNARNRLMLKAKKTVAKHAKNALKDLIDELIPNPDEITIDAEYTIECPVCHEQVTDIEHHVCKKE